ncbi:MAG: hypothetical protein HUU34_03825 [Saprospiraceae bacterium]|jgi:hypothetical protein|nr:hypothetical protein [Saprospiraceae bacterium]
MKSNLQFAAFIFALYTVLSGVACYSLRGIDIDPNVNTYFVDQFRNNASNAPPSLPQTFTEALKEKIRTESRLVYTDTDPDISFKGAIVDFRVTSEAPQPGETTSLNRLTITTAIEYIHAKDEKKGWKSNFSFFYDFPSSTDLGSIQDDAIDVISKQMMEDIFNKAFTNW